MIQRECFEIQHYDEIPSYILGKNILDVGSADCYGAYHSKHKLHFRTNNYLGLDIQHFDRPYMQKITRNIFEFETDHKFDTIIMSHVLEHFPITEWSNLFSKILSLLEPRGFVIINVPYQQQKAPFVDNEYMHHKTLNIDRNVLLSFLPFQKFYYGYNENHDRVIFRNHGENLFYALARFFYRIIKGHKYSLINTFRQRPVRIIAIYQKLE